MHPTQTDPAISSIKSTFSAVAARSQPRKRRPAPFSIRLSDLERERLLIEADGAPLGGFIKSKLLGGPAPIKRRKRVVAPVEDRQMLAGALSALGQSRLSNNLNQLARLAHIGALPLSPEVEAELMSAFADIRTIRDMLMKALGAASGESQ